MASMVSSLMDNQLVWNVVGLCAFTLHDASGWRWWHYGLWAALIAAAMEILAKLVIAGGMTFGMHKEGKRIKDSAKPLSELSSLDMVFISINKLMTAAFTYHVISYCWHSGNISWSIKDANWLNAGLSIVALYVFYDFWYYWFHRFLHIPSLYPLVHKHHHRQHSPFRGNADAINVHLFEFVTGEYNHLFSIHAVTLGLMRLPALVTSLSASYPAVGSALASVLPSASSAEAYKLHLGAVAVFIIAGGVLASLNHTRFDMRLSFLLWEVRFHDIHHARNVRTNYSQYTMLWDRLFGTFLPYKEDNNVSPASSSSNGVPSKAKSS